MALFVSQVLNGLQLGLMLFLLAAGLSVVFGIMDFMNLAHGVFYMLAAYTASLVGLASGSFFLAVVCALAAAGLAGLLVEISIVNRLYKRSHLDQVLATFGLILCFETAVKFLAGPESRSILLPGWLSGPLTFGPLTIPSYRIFVVGCGLATALLLWFIIARTRIGMIVRATASNERMARALGLRTKVVFASVFAFGAMLAGLAGVLVAPLTGASLSMGTQIIILAFVVIIIGGIGSVFGAFVAALMVGMIDTLGRAYISTVLGWFASPMVASSAGPAIASILIYLIMTIVLLIRPSGLFPPANR